MRPCEPARRRETTICGRSNFTPILHPWLSGRPLDRHSSTRRSLDSRRLRAALSSAGRLRPRPYSSRSSADSSGHDGTRVDRTGNRVASLDVVPKMPKRRAYGHRRRRHGLAAQGLIRPTSGSLSPPMLRSSSAPALRSPIELGAEVPYESSGDTLHVWDWSSSKQSKVMKDVRLRPEQRICVSPDGTQLVWAKRRRGEPRQRRAIDDRPGRRVSRRRHRRNVAADRTFAVHA